MGNLPKENNDLHYVEFQNSADQNYPYETWDKISYFKEILESTKILTTKEITKKMNEGFVLYNEEDIIPRLDYYRKTVIYNQIYKSLDLDNVLYKKEGNYKIFSMQAINSTEELYRISRELELIKKEVIKEFENE